MQVAPGQTLLALDPRKVAQARKVDLGTKRPRFLCFEHMAVANALFLFTDIRTLSGFVNAKQLGREAALHFKCVQRAIRDLADERVGWLETERVRDGLLFSWSRGVLVQLDPRCRPPLGYLGPRIHVM